MARGTSGSIARQIEALFKGGSVAGLSDRQLLEQFTARRDDAGEAAFAALVTRHGPMVLRVCRRLLGDLHHAEDAFQAVFLVLARRARSIRDPDLLGHWLSGVALRTARCAKLQLARRRRHEEGHAMRHPGSGSSTLVEPAVPPAQQTIVAREQAEALHEEIERLPRTFRLPIVLCYFEGLTVEEAARRLRSPHGTIRSRLARAREKLRRGLTRRGIVLPAAALASALSPRSASASISSPLYTTTTKAAMSFAAGPAVAGTASASAIALAQEVLRSMLIHHLKVFALTVLFLGAVATGAGYLTHSWAMKDEPGKTPAGRQSRPVAKSDRPDRSPVPGPGRMIVTGRVLDPDGKPAAEVLVDIMGRARKPWVSTRDTEEDRVVLGRSATDGDGRYRIEAARTSWTGFFEVYAIAAAPGFGLSSVPLNADAQQPAAELRLLPEQIIRGKVVDIHGQPAAGVELRVWSVGRPTNIGTFDGVSMGNSPPPEGLRIWPRSLVSDDQGRFTLAGIGREVTVGFHVHDRRFASSGFRVQTDDRDGPKTVKEVLQPARVVEGRALAADTGRPIAGTVVEGVRADDHGRFTANPRSSLLARRVIYRIEAFPPEGIPYLASVQEFEGTKGVVKMVIDIKLPRGVLIRGKVTEQGTGRPLESASVQYIPARHRDSLIYGWQAVVASHHDGSYQIAVPPGKGYLFVYGSTPDYILESIGGRMIAYDQPGGERFYAHSIIAYEVKGSDSPHEIAVALRPGKTIKGRLVGPEGQTVDQAEIVALIQFNYFHLNWRGDLTIHARDGAFALHGLDPEKATRVSFLDAEHQWGATVELSGNQAGEDLTIRLQPCGQARARFIGPGGKPIAKFASRLEILGTPGPPKGDRRPESKSELTADAASMANLDRTHYWHGPLTDTEGRVTLPDLVPGALYRISDFSTMNIGNKGVQVRKDFTVQPGETLDLGDILIEKPQAQ